MNRKDIAGLLVLGGVICAVLAFNNLKAGEYGWMAINALTAAVCIAQGLHLWKR